MKNYSDIEKIRNKIEWLRRTVDPSKRWWSETLFHFTDVHNAVNILTTGSLYSRNHMLRNGGMQNDNASPEVINQTSEQWKDYVRFYFRPRTPTQYHNEGFRPVSQRTLGGAHCPMPIFFLFDSLPILSMRSSSFSHSTLASSNSVYSTGRMFEEIPFNNVYHEGSFDSYYERHIIGNRQAEVIVPNSCSLEHLRLIVCRSPAERETLIELLPQDVYDHYEQKIVVDTRLNLFNCDWMYIERVTMTKENVVFTFNPGIRVTSTYHALFEIEETATGLILSWEDEKFSKRSNFTLSLRNVKNPEEYKVKFFLDECLAYTSSFIDEDLLPF